MYFGRPLGVITTVTWRTIKRYQLHNRYVNIKNVFSRADCILKMIISPVVFKGWLKHSCWPLMILQNRFDPRYLLLAFWSAISASCFFDLQYPLTVFMPYIKLGNFSVERAIRGKTLCNMHKAIQRRFAFHRDCRRIYHYNGDMKILKWCMSTWVFNFQFQLCRI